MAQQNQQLIDIIDDIKESVISEGDVSPEDIGAVIEHLDELQDDLERAQLTLSSALSRVRGFIKALHLVGNIDDDYYELDVALTSLENALLIEEINRGA